MITINDVLSRLSSPVVEQLPTPPYIGNSEVEQEGGVTRRARVGLAVESMRQHMTNEGWEIFAGLQHNGYLLAGYQLPYPYTDVRQILQLTNPDTLILQDKREWDVAIRDFREPKARFTNVEVLRDRHDVFKLTILKDSQQRPEYHRQSADEIGCHAWIIYYHPRIVHHLAPYTRSQHLIRTYHSVDSSKVPPYRAIRRHGCLLSGAVSNAYPLRQRLFKEVASLPYTTPYRHPGYHRNGSATPRFLHTLSKYRVAICTASMYGYALRKLIEATACGCVVVTDLPSDEVLPEIDGNLVRVNPEIPTRELGQLLAQLHSAYSPERQEHYAQKARQYYDYRALTARLVSDIQTLKDTYTT